MNCPKCGGEMYDNRQTKKSPKQPDYKCKAYKEGCEGVIWPNTYPLRPGTPSGRTTASLKPMFTPAIPGVDKDTSIIRQCCLKAAVEYEARAGDSTSSVEEVIATAAYFEKWVTRPMPKPKPVDDVSIPNEAQDF